MANAVIPWDQRPEYLAYTDWTPIPGITSYPVPRNGTGTDVTKFHPGQAFLSEHNLPDIMYQLHPCAEWKRFKRSPGPGPRQNADGSLVYEQWTRPGCDPQPLRDFKLLPDKISSTEAWWYHEFVRRMDPRIRQRDIIMREEVSAERLRMGDQQYINIHLNTPGYRNYRPSWKMISWHRTGGSETENQRKHSVLDSLTDAQKNANTTRGSTPGLINPVLGDVLGNRIALPSVVLRKRGPKGGAVNVGNPPATQLAQPAQVQQNPPAPQTQHEYQNQQSGESSRARSSNVATLAIPGPSAIVDTPSHKVAGTAAGLNDLQSAHAQDSDTVAMPPPLFPDNLGNGLPPPPHGITLHQTNDWPPENYGTQVDVSGMEGFRATNNHLRESEYPFMSDDEMATMSAKSAKAMAEIHRMCEPFFESGFNFQGPPLMDLSAELIENLGMSFLFPPQEDEQARGKGDPNAMPNPVQTLRARDVAQETTPVLPEKQGTKRKGFNDGNENFQQVQLDVERQEQRPIKQVKSVHHANLHNDNTNTYHGAVYHAQQQHFTPRLEDHQLGYSYGQDFGGPTLQDAGIFQFGDYQFGYSHGQDFGGPVLQDIGPPQLVDYELGYDYQQNFGGPILQDTGAPQFEGYQSVSSHRQDFGGPTLQDIRPPQHASVEEFDPYSVNAFCGEQNGAMIEQHPGQTLEPSHIEEYPAMPASSTFFDNQPSVGWPYIHEPTEGAQPSDYQPLESPPHESTGTFFHNDLQVGETSRHPTLISSPIPDAQPPNPQSAAWRPRSRLGRGHTGEPLGVYKNDYRYHPY